MAPGFGPARHRDPRQFLMTRRSPTPFLRRERRCSARPESASRLIETRSPWADDVSGDTRAGTLPINKPSPCIAAAECYSVDPTRGRRRPRAAGPSRIPVRGLCLSTFLPGPARERRRHRRLDNQAPPRTTITRSDLHGLGAPAGFGGQVVGGTCRSPTQPRVATCTTSWGKTSA
jgi:hypothetical protein